MIFQGLLLSTFSDNAKKFYADHNVQGKILLFDYNSPEKDVTELKFSDGFDLTNFVPHGISLYQSPESGLYSLRLSHHCFAC